MATWRETFYHCEHCGSVVMKYGTHGQTPSCCGEQMQVLVPHTKDDPGDASPEKHLPRMKRGRVITVSVGTEADPHPMEPDHHIEWIYVATEMGSQLVKMRPGLEPFAHFALNGDIPLTIYAYCNKHGLWATKIFDSMQPNDE